MKLIKILILTLLPFIFAACGIMSGSNQSDVAANANKSAPSATPVPTPNVKRANFVNGTYETSSCREIVGLPDKVTLKLYKFEDPAQRFYHIRDDQMIYGDLDGDNNDEAVASIFCGGRQSKLTSFEIHVYTELSTKMILLARIDSLTMAADYKKSDPKGLLTTLAGARPEIKDGKLLVKVPTEGENISPKNLTTFTYKLDNGKLVLQGKPSKMPLQN